MEIDVKCLKCNAKMDCIFSVKQVDDTTMRKFKLAIFLGGIYKCSYCGKTVEVHVKGK